MALSKEGRQFISEEIRFQRKEGKPPKQAQAIAFSEARERGFDVPEPKGRIRMSAEAKARKTVRQSKSFPRRKLNSMV